MRRRAPTWTGARDHRHLKALADPKHAEVSRWFFKTGPGEYGEGDRFLGIRVPVIRAQVRQLDALPMSDAERLLQSAWHEERLLAV